MNSPHGTLAALKFARCLLPSLLWLAGIVLAQSVERPIALAQSTGPLLGNNASLVRLQPLPDFPLSKWSVTADTLPQLIQNVRFTSTVFSDGASDGLDQSDFSASSSVLLSKLLFDSDFSLSVSPSFSTLRLLGPAYAELPHALYRTGVNVMWMKRSSERSTYMLSVAPNAATDFQTSAHAFRLFATAVSSYQWRPDIQFMYGAAYLDRNDINVLPYAGVVWTPEEDLSITLAAPRPMIAKRISSAQPEEEPYEDWIYFGGELGGGAWAVERRPGYDDELTIRDYRLVAGWQGKQSNRRYHKVEIGVVLGRKLQYQTDNFVYQPGNALILRGGFSF